MHPKDFNSIVSALKRAFSRSTVRYEVLMESKCPRKKGPKGGARYRCISCRDDFDLRGVQVDHIEPVIPVTIKAKDMTWDEIVARLYCEPANLQVLCKKCHKKKSQSENRRRRG
jgi:5-methylcytosine-specific restriction endonuclease McrA